MAAEAKVYAFVTTDVGRRKIVSAISKNTPINLTHIAVGDGGGAEYDPVTTQTALKGERWRGEVNKKVLHPQDPNIVIVTGIVPPAVGGFFVREIGLIDESGDLIYISAYPTSYKPTPASGISKDMTLEQWIIVEDTATITLTADLNVVTATISDLRQLDDKYTPEIGMVTLDNTKQYPFNSSAATVNLIIPRDTLDYTIQTELVSSTGMVGDIEVFDKQVNGFKLRFTGGGTQAEIKYYVRGGLNR